MYLKDHGNQIRDGACHLAHDTLVLLWNYPLCISLVALRG